MDLLWYFYRGFCLCFGYYSLGCVYFMSFCLLLLGNICSYQFIGKALNVDRNYLNHISPSLLLIRNLFRVLLKFVCSYGDGIKSPHPVIVLPWFLELYSVPLFGRDCCFHLMFCLHVISIRYYYFFLLWKFFGTLFSWSLFSGVS